MPRISWLVQIATPQNIGGVQRKEEVSVLWLVVEFCLHNAHATDSGCQLQGLKNLGGNTDQKNNIMKPMLGELFQQHEEKEKLIINCFLNVVFCSWPTCY